MKKVILISLCLFYLLLFVGCDSENNKSKNSSTVSYTNFAENKGSFQEIKINLSPNAYAPITVVKDIPVKFIIMAKEEDLTGCNQAINIPEYGIKRKGLKAGENIIEFTPKRSGKFIYTCWMGMIKSSITVVESANRK